MSHLGQTEKNSVRAYVFRFALKLGHCYAFGMSQKCQSGNRGGLLRGSEETGMAFLTLLRRIEGIHKPLQRLAAPRSAISSVMASAKGLQRSWSGRAQNKLKNRALREIWSKPQASIVGFNDRPADRQAHAVRLRCERGVEYALDIFRVDSHSGVRH